MDNAITRAEHEEFKQRMEDEHQRASKRLGMLEVKVDKLYTLTASVEKLAVNMENMIREQERQGNRLEALESRDGERWRQAIGYVIAAVVGAACTAVFSRWGI